jgi:hypothetical protein
MPTPTYTPLATVTLSSSASSVIFSSIPATYRDLVLVTNVTHSGEAEIDLAIRFNGDTGNNYNRASVTGNGSVAASFAVLNENYLYVLAASTTSSVATLQIMDYSATDKHKPCLSRGNLTAGRVSATANRWANTAPINSISVAVLSANFLAGSTFSLYGVIA